MPRKPAASAPYTAFGALLAAHLRAGQRPDANNREPWTDTAFAKLIPSRDADSTGVSPRAVVAWRRGTSLPSAVEPILNALFGPFRTDGGTDRESLRTAYITARDDKESRVILATPPDPAGETFAPKGDQLAIRRTPPPDDIAATRDPDLLADHPTAVEQARLLADLAARRQNKLSDAWADLRLTAQHLLAALDVPTEQLAESALAAYRALVRLGSLLEQQKTLIDRPEPGEAPLDAELFRYLRDTVALIVPILRVFPSVQRRDAAQASFWTAADLTASSAIIDSADRREVVPAADIDLLREIEASAKRPGTQAAKSKGHQVTTIRQMLLAGAAALLLNGYASTSPLVARVSGFFVEIEKQITIVAAGMSADVGGAVKYALERAMEDGNPLAPLPQSIEPTSGTQSGPPWSSAFGRDQYGTYADFTLPGADITQRMRWVPPGRFTMGSPDKEEGRFDHEGPQQEVEFAQGYWLFDTPCTQALWQGVMDSNPSHFVHPLRPVERVDFNRVQAFIARLNKRIKGLELSLPSEAEFERAARAGSATATWAGNLDIKGRNNAPVLDAVAWYGGNSGVEFDLADGEDSSQWEEKQFPHERAGTRRVKTKAANPWGFYDLLGNVWEWCADTWPASDEGAPLDGSAWIDDIAGFEFRVIRGGSWFAPARDVRAAMRHRLYPDDRFDYLGFRCARVQVPGEAERRAGRRERPARSARAVSASPERSGEAASSSSSRPKGEKF